MNKKILIGLFCIILSCRGQTTNFTIKTPLTSKYAGTYSKGKDIDKEENGTIFIYPETDSSVLFYFDLNRGAPSYNMGSLYGRVKILNNCGIFNTNSDFSEEGCKLTFQFIKSTLIIKTEDGKSDCGFGHGVFADGKYQKKSNIILDYFEDQESRKVFFKDTKPEDYYKE
jgi:hypothetical protein